MTYIFRPSHYNVTDAAQARVYEPGGALPWWNPDGATPGGVGGVCVGAYQAKGVASYAASLINLANPGTYNLVEGNGAVPWAGGSGWGFVAPSAQYFNTGIVPSLNPAAWSVLIQYSALTVAGTLFGLYNIAVENFLIQAVGLGPGFMRAYNSRFGDNAPALTSGNYGFAAKQPYRNGIAEPALIPASTSPTALTIFIGALNFSGVPGQYPTVNIESMGVYNITLTAPQFSARAAAMAAL